MGGTYAEADHNTLRSKAVRQVIEQELLAFLSEHNEELLDRVGKVYPLCLAR